MILIVLRITYVSAVFLMIGKALFSSNKMMPYLIWLPNNWYDDESWTLLQLVYFFAQSSAAYALILSISVVDNLYVTVVVHLVAHLTIINDNYKNMFKQDGNHHSTMVDVVQRQTLTFR